MGPTIARKLQEDMPSYSEASVTNSDERIKFLDDDDDGTNFKLDVFDLNSDLPNANSPLLQKKPMGGMGDLDGLSEVSFDAL